MPLIQVDPNTSYMDPEDLSGNSIEANKLKVGQQVKWAIPLYNDAPVTDIPAQGIKMDRSTPEACIRSFCAALSGQAMRTAIECVAGADSTAISDSFFQEMQSHPIKMAIDSATTTITGNSATCAISGKFLPDGTMTDGKGLFLKETINLTNSGDGWKIVPPKTAKLEEDRVDILVSTIAYLLKNPAVMEHARSQAQGTSCVSNLKQMALCSLMYAQDYKETFPSKSVEIHKALLPYCKNAAIFSCPQTKKAYTFNSAVRGKKLASIKSPATTVLIYEGTDNKLSFVHDGKAGVAFADGHVKLIDAKEAAKYSWTP